MNKIDPYSTALPSKDDCFPNDRPGAAWPKGDSISPALA